ncbi:hypothetical protein [Methylobacterium sp. Leaf108]|uniref:hypothetical protein n=1 Tax=Methylobacterium sp. Leaf108 TaxID=1736256 RepID=UPI0006FA5BCE|nr:hypothetical protein [Methylobacterium sp. Leaf108]KQP50549.1 hypothetical protein ASF39_12745 [Methylobacterium sp. Leaf108]
MGLGAGIATGRGRLCAVVLLAILAAFSRGADAEAAKLLAVKGQQADRYGRIVLTFDSQVAVKATVSGSVMVVRFGEASPSGPERIAAEMPDYVTAVRRDPDGTGMRIALQRPFRLNVQSAGEQVFIDLLTEAWSGLPPPLPPETVAELFRRTKAAEAALRAAMPPPEPRRLVLELSHLPTVTRLSLRLPPEAAPRFERIGEAETRLSIPGAWRIDDVAARGRTKPAIEALAVETDVTGARLRVTPAAGWSVRTDRDEDGVTLDVVRTDPSEPAKSIAIANPLVTAKAAAQAPSPAAQASSPAAQAPSPAAVGAGAQPPAQKPADEMRPVPAPSPVAVVRPDGPGLAFPFKRLPPAALFERAGIATLVFETAEPVPAPATEPPFVSVGPPLRTAGVVALRFSVPRDRLLDLVPMGSPEAPTGWELVAGENLSASENLQVTRRSESGGRLAVAVNLPRPGSATWLDLDGERVAVVTGHGPRPASIPKRQLFVDFEILQSRQGVAVLAQADDLLVRPDIDGVAIARESGMAVSGVARALDPILAAVNDLAVERGPWEASRSAGVRDLLVEQSQAAAGAARPVRGPLRLVLAKTLLANRFDLEALGVLGAAAAEDPVIAGQRDVAILTGIALARTDRAAEARRIFGAEAFKRDPEARLWSAFLDAKAGRWKEADAGFRATADVLDRYPDDLQAQLRAGAAEAAVETGDWETASRQLTTAAARAADRLIQDRIVLLRARVDEVTGQTAAAFSAYERLVDAAVEPVAAEATLRAAVLGQALGKMPTPEAIERLERLLLTWRGGDVQFQTIATLSQLYSQARQWRQAFLAARRAEAFAPDSPLARTLHASAQALFDDLFLGERASLVSGVEALALYFDFKEFAPIGRRGDEIVRRLADRLVQLDLLDSAGELLQHQVDHRLTGAARAGVAARLASIRIMDEKPLLALKVIDATYAPELPEDLRRARALLRARALSDLSRTDLALETIEGETGPDASRLRADILWSGRRWREAGEAHEALVGEAWRARTPLEDAMRADVIRAAVAYGLAGETLGIERLRAKFAGAMAESADARTFALLTQPNAVRSQGFREVAQKATSAETLKAFLKEYRKRYPDTAVPPRGQRDGETRAAVQGEAPAVPPG